MEINGNVGVLHICCTQDTFMQLHVSHTALKVTISRLPKIEDKLTM